MLWVHRDGHGLTGMDRVDSQSKVGLIGTVVGSQGWGGLTGMGGALTEMG